MTDFTSTITTFVPRRTGVIVGIRRGDLTNGEADRIARTLGAMFPRVTIAVVVDAASVSFEYADPDDDPDDERLRQIAVDIWDEDVATIREAADEIDRLRAQRDADGDLLMTAWGLLANVSEGNWERQTDEWQDAVKRWRTRFHERLDVVKVGEPEEES